MARRETHDRRPGAVGSVSIHALGLLGLVLLSGTAIGPGKRLLVFIGGHDMWLKILGVLCAGVFVGAAVLEAVKARREHRARDDEETSEGDVPAPESDGGAVETR
jgi:hypothetical protein